MSIMFVEEAQRCHIYDMKACNTLEISMGLCNA